jgi:myosin phosphatase Rho-interacting protein
LYYVEDVIRDEKLKDIANKITNITATQEKDRKSRWTMSEAQIMDETPTRDDVNKQKRPQSLSIISTAPAIISVVKKKNAPPLPSDLINYNQKTSHSHESIRGDPDGDCGMEDLPAKYCNKDGELRVKLPSEEILDSKSGWLLKEDLQGDWSKYWFSLKGGGLFYYRDPSAEERGVLDGVLDVNSITSIKEITSNRNHAFQLTVIASLIISIFSFPIHFPLTHSLCYLLLLSRVHKL